MKLLFIYNAKSGLLALAKDALHKWFLPETYPCQLCALTWGNFGEKKNWREYYQAQQWQAEFLHSDEVAKAYPSLELPELPCVMIVSDTCAGELISREDMEHLHDEQGLIHLLDQRLSDLDVLGSERETQL